MDTIELQRWPGLTDAIAAQRLAAEGFNELPADRRKSIFKLLLQVLTEPMLLLLLGSGAVYGLLGEPRDAAMLLSFVVVVVGITLYQNRKTERTLAELRNLSSPRAAVMRNGEQKRIPGREVVRGDVILLREGDRVPADATIVFGANLQADESLLTGESMPVRKVAAHGSAPDRRPGGDDLPFVYSGSMIVAGHGVAAVTTTGARTAMGKIGQALVSISTEETLIHKETKRLVRLFTTVGLSLCVVVTLTTVAMNGTLLAGLLAGLTLGMALLPEELPVILIIFLTLGAYRIAKKHVLTRRPEAIETLGAATVLCVDKTGTLTKNRMTLGRLALIAAELDVRGEPSTGGLQPYHQLIEYATLASQRDPYDPIEREINRFSAATLEQTEHLHHDWRLVREYPLSRSLLALSHVWSAPGGREFVIAAKGAPETIADLCHLPPPERQQLLGRVHAMAKEGLRVLGVAQARFAGHDLPPSQHDFPFAFVGLLGFIDPVRETVPAALRDAYTAGLRVIMMTGDYPETARAVAVTIGMRRPEAIISGEQLAAMTAAELQTAITATDIFARIVPEQKLAIVNALKANGEIVAMTGDGVNDAPALKAAHIGIAMGERGTDVAREASSLVLLNDDFSSIVAAVRLGRRIFDNLRQAMAYTVAVHIPIALMALLPPLFRLPPVLFPAHIAFLELIIDPACSTVFEAEPEDPDIMKRPPRRLNEPMLGRRVFQRSLWQGLAVSMVVLAGYGLALALDRGATARSIAFIILVFGNLALIVANLPARRWSLRRFHAETKAFRFVVGGALLALFLVMVIPFSRSLFHFGPVALSDLVIVIVAILVFVGISRMSGWQKMAFAGSRRIR